MSNQAPFRYDVVGSFLRPEYLKDARAKFAEGKITDCLLYTSDAADE